MDFLWKDYLSKNNYLIQMLVSHALALRHTRIACTNHFRYLSYILSGRNLVLTTNDPCSEVLSWGHKVTTNTL